MAIELGDTLYAITGRSSFGPGGERQGINELLTGNMPGREGERAVLLFSTAEAADRFVAQSGNPELAVVSTRDPQLILTALDQLVAQGVNWVVFNWDQTKNQVEATGMEDFRRHCRGMR